VGTTVLVLVAVGVMGVAMKVGVSVGADVSVGETVGEWVLVDATVAVDVTVGVLVRVGVRVDVAVRVAVAVFVGVRVEVGVRVGVRDEVGAVVVFNDVAAVCWLASVATTLCVPAFAETLIVRVFDALPLALVVKFQVETTVDELPMSYSRSLIELLGANPVRSARTVMPAWMEEAVSLTRGRTLNVFVAVFPPPVALSVWSPVVAFGIVKVPVAWPEPFELMVSFFEPSNWTMTVVFPGKLRTVTVTDVPTYPW